MFCGIFLHNGSVTNMSTESLKSSCVCLLSWSMLICQPGRVVCTLPCVPNLVLLKLEWKWLYQPARQSRTFPDHYSVHCNFYTHHSLLTLVCIRTQHHRNMVSLMALYSNLQIQYSVVDPRKMFRRRVKIKSSKNKIVERLVFFLLN